MMNEMFPHPHEDESAEDPFTGPADSYSEQSLGASPMNPVAAARAPRRRLALFAIAGSIALLAVFFLMSLRSRGDGDLDAPIVTGHIDTVARAQPASSASRQDILEISTSSWPVTRSSGRSNADLLDPRQLGVDSLNRPPALGGADPLAPEIPIAAPPTTPEAPLYPGDLVTPPSQRQLGAVYAPPANAQQSQAPGAFDEEELERQARLDAMREAAERARAEAEAREAARKAEEERLRSRPTLVAEAANLLEQGAGSARPAGSSRFGLDEEGSGMTEEGVRAAGESNAEITPGTRVMATLVSEFISDAQGGGRVEARLDEALRSRRGTLLPAGTRAYGTAQAAVPSPGRQARVELSFDVFVTPDGTVVRNVKGYAADPETLAFSIPGKVDHRYLERIARGTISTAVDLAITQGAEDRRSAFELPSPRDMAIDDARRRLGAIINGPIGDETSIPPAVKLESGTRFVMIFGL